ncbi:MAG: type II CRISPR RNA-guided endonuclease Cas9 [Planctomycetes bacterium RBG_13_63_9]|nr:CRISPR-associated protein Cas9 [uncultured bacterium]OHB66451.1 MAG: type II CRISPR RNA-guided endonuclease Cas9 [Planctomycetes bacterium RBG_13_63_9]
MSTNSTTTETDGKYRLGVDMGAASIGWTAVLEGNGTPSALLAAGVRCFEAGVLGDIEQGKDESRATARRDARGPRRLAWRRQHRLRRVFRLLQEFSFLPPSDDDSHDERHRGLARIDKDLRARLKTSDRPADEHLLPYLLRARALDEKLAREELGRALYHLAQRRGFQSNLKAAKKDEDVGVVKQGISELEKLIEDAGSRTLGEYFASLDPEEHRIRGRWTARGMYVDEFQKIWAAQAAHHADLSDEQRERLFHAIFDQRPLKSQKNLIGMCDLEPRKRRAPAACLEFQHFRILQRVNDLLVTAPDGECRSLTPEERAVLLGELAEKDKVTFGRIRTLLKMRKSREYDRSYSFNFEEGGEKQLIGNRTAARLLAILGDRWRQLADDKQRQLVNEILSFESEEPLIHRLTNGWGFEPSSARAIAETGFEPGYGALSRKAIRRLLPMLRQGVPYATARKELYGDVQLKQGALDHLPAGRQCSMLRNLRNPAVARALGELRKVVNALIRKYGMPRSIRIELARDLKHARKRRQDMADQNKRNRTTREEACSRILTEMKDDRYGTPGNILKVRLAEECNWECPYTGRSISMAALVGDQPQFDVEHIMPLGRSLDNSYLNKTLCYHEENRKVKRGRTPFEAYGGTEPWEGILERVRRFKADPHVRRRKLDLFQVDTLPDTDEFNARQLNDTRYMSRLAAEYLGLLFGGQIDAQGQRRVQVSPGRVTAYLRREWQLNRLLGDPNRKDRADHRHHAVDALVIALTGAREVQLLSRAAEQAEALWQTGLFVAVDPPWEGFLDEARRAVDAIQVSSRVSRRLSGKLHKETIYSKPIEYIDQKGQRKQVHHLRKRLEDLSKQEVEQIVDDRVRALVQEKLQQPGATPDKTFKEPGNHPYFRTADGRIIPIHKVRIRTSEHPIIVGKGSKERHVKPGSNHHMEIVALLDEQGQETKWEGHIVSLFEAVGRRRRGQPIIRRDHGENKRFKFSLAGGEHVVMEHEPEKPRLYRVASISGKNVEFRLHCDARPIILLRQKEYSAGRVRRSADSLRMAKARKVAVDPLGNIFPAND